LIVALKGDIFVTDRGNNRIQIFDQAGNHLDTWHHSGRIGSLLIASDDVLLSIDSVSSELRNPGWRKGMRIGH